VITSVTRDDLTDGGASAFVSTIRAVRELTPDCQVEVLVPDFGGSEEALHSVLESRPDVLNHNIEVVQGLFPAVRPQGDYGRSLELINRAKRTAPHVASKSGFMVGLGEKAGQISQTMRDLREAGCELLTVGQYLGPSRDHHPVERYYTPEDFDALREEAMGMGFLHVASGPLVRSSYHAAEQHAATYRGG
jgi:lipoic acid synthetase